MSVCLSVCPSCTEREIGIFASQQSKREFTFFEKKHRVVCYAPQYAYEVEICHCVSEKYQQLGFYVYTIKAKKIRIILTKHNHQKILVLSYTSQKITIGLCLTTEILIKNLI